MTKLLLGKNIIDKPVYWEMNREKNPHMIVLGTSGSGKTETLKTIVANLKEKNISSMVIDFHNEFEDITDNRLNLRDNTINPLEVPKNERPENIVYEISDIIGKIFKLGEIQEAILRKAIRDCYLDHGIDLKKSPTTKKFPDFSDVKKNILKQSNPNVHSLMSRIEVLFNLDIFSNKTEVSFKDIVSTTTIIELKDFPTENVKSAIAEFFLNKLTYYFYSLNKSDNLKYYCIIDEAHRLMYENSPINKLLRESRKYGVGIILSSQRPSDFNETILANSGAILSFQCNLDKDAKYISKQLNLEPKKIKNLTEPGLGYIKFSRKERPEKIKIVRIKKKHKEKKVDIKEEKTEETKKTAKKPSTNLFFFTEEKITKYTWIRIFFVSLSFIIGIWSLIAKSILFILFVSLGFIWMPVFSNILKVRKFSEKIDNFIKLILSLVVIYLFYLLF
ncbi:MAG: hypothetical protein B6U88_00905 [Candidatus Aenigmarchaeota archaeon ex4484_56]|nr:MAG: hypothetical protein B6U88_00905 [Candidatus Aenigmarchaeota archaeon ex4484_56]